MSIEGTDEPTFGIEDATSDLAIERQSLFDGLVEFAAEKLEGSEETHYTDPIPIPGWDGRLGVRYRLVRLEDLERRGKALKKSRLRGAAYNLRIALDTIAVSCDEVLFYSARRDEYISASDENSPVPIRFDDQLTSLIKWPTFPDTYSIIKALWPSEMAIIATAMELNKWFANPDYEIDTEALGE